MDVEQLETLVSFMRREGLTFLKTADVELHLGPQPHGEMPEPPSDQPNYDDLPAYEKFAQPFFKVNG